MNLRSWELMILSVFLLGLGLAPQNTPVDSAPSIGINIGDKMPSFTGLDQFGHEVSSGTLRGPNGTVLLFFRSADW